MDEKLTFFVSTPVRFEVDRYIAEAVRSFYRGGDRVPAIKLVRGHMGLSLREAKDLCDKIYEIHTTYGGIPS